MECFQADASVSLRYMHDGGYDIPDWSNRQCHYKSVQTKNSFLLIGKLITKLLHSRHWEYTLKALLNNVKVTKLTFRLKYKSHVPRVKKGCHKDGQFRQVDLAPLYNHDINPVTEVTRTMSLDELSVSSIPLLSTSHPFGVTVSNVPAMIQAAMTGGASLENMWALSVHGGIIFY